MQEMSGSCHPFFASHIYFFFFFGIVQTRIHLNIYIYIYMFDIVENYDCRRRRRCLLVVMLETVFYPSQSAYIHVRVYE